VPFWLPNLRQAGTDYAAADLPHCEHKVAHSLEMGWNYYRPDVRGMRRLASAFLKVQDHLDELRAHEAKQHEREERREDRFAAAARRAAKAARGTRA
jgi:hypothetical protein